MNPMHITDAFLVLGDTKIPIIFFSIDFYQSDYQNTGRVRGKVMGGDMLVKVENLNVPTLINAMVNPNQTQDGSIKFMDGPALSGEIKFTKGSFKNLDIHWSANGAIAKDLTIVAPQIDIFGTVHDKTATAA